VDFASPAFRSQSGNSLNPCGMPQCTVAPIIHPGPNHVGPAIPWALRAEPPGGKAKDKDGKDTAKPVKRKKWDERHEVTWKNDAQAPNTRCYFGRHVDRVDVPVVPRRRLRPTWVLDCPEVESPTQAYRIFDAMTASWKEQPQWTMPSVADMPRNAELVKQATKGALAAEPSKSTGSLQPRSPEGVQAAKPQSPEQSSTFLAALETARKKNQASAPKVRTPRKPPDLKTQRTREKEWDKKHGVVFSKDNQDMQSNVRSYFDRWKDFESGVFEREPTWRLKIERKPLVAKSASEPYIPNFGPQGGRYGAWHPMF